jgi:sugar phosphate isomerase/epimerase
MVTQGENLEIGVNTAFFHEYKLEEILRLIEGMGFDSAEIWIETPDIWAHESLEKRISYLKEAVRRSTLSLTMHAPFHDLNLSSYNPKIIQLTIDESLDSVKLASSIGVKFLTFHGGKAAFSKQSKYDMELLRKGISEIYEESIRRNVQVCVENSSPNDSRNILTKPTDIARIMSKIPLKLTFDVSHALMFGKNTVFDFIQRFVDQMAVVHLSLYNGKSGLHLPISRSPALAKEIVSRLVDSGFDGFIIFELSETKLPKKDKISVLKNELLLLRSML